MSLETSAHCRVNTSSVGAWSTPLIAERNSSQARTESQARALICSRVPKGRTKGGGASVGAEDDYCVTNVGSVPTAELMKALGWTEEPSGTLGITQGNATPSGTKGGQGGIQRTQPPTKEHGPNKTLPIINEPLITNALLLKRRGEEVLRVRLARVSQDESTLNGAKNITLLCAAISGELAARGQSGNGVGLMLPLSPGRRLRKVSAQSGANVRPLSVAKHVDKVQISRHQRFKRAIEH